MVPTNPGEQFYTFTCLAAWLIRKAGKSFEMPQESDDPNSTIALILDYLRDIDVPVDFPPNKLKQGTGEHAVYVLDNLADNALKIAKFKWNKVNILPDEPTPEPDIEDDDAELILEKVEEEMMAEYDDDEQDVLHIDDITKFYSETIVRKIFYSQREKYIPFYYAYIIITIVNYSLHNFNVSGRSAKTRQHPRI